MYIEDRHKTPFRLDPLRKIGKAGTNLGWITTFSQQPYSLRISNSQGRIPQIGSPLRPFTPRKPRLPLGV